MRFSNLPQKSANFVLSDSSDRRAFRLNSRFDLTKATLDAFEATQGLFALRGRFIAMCRRLVAVRLDFDGDDFKDMQ